MKKRFLVLIAGAVAGIGGIFLIVAIAQTITSMLSWTTDNQTACFGVMMFTLYPAMVAGSIAGTIWAIDDGFSGDGAEGRRLLAETKIMLLRTQQDLEAVRKHAERLLGENNKLRGLVPKEDAE